MCKHIRILMVSGADPGFLKRGIHLRSTSQKKGGGVHEGVQL